MVYDSVSARIRRQGVEQWLPFFYDKLETVFDYVGETALIGFEQWPLALPRAFVITGLLGGLTTFSAFSGESLQLLDRGQFGLAGLHAAAHVLGSLACAAAGFALARWVLRA